MAIEEVFLGAFLSVLFEKLASPHAREIAGRLNIHPRLEKLKGRLEETQQLLDDAENKQITSDAVAVRRWLGGLRCWAQDAEDLLDEFATNCQLDMGSSSKIPGFIGKVVISIGYKYRAAAEINKICVRLDDFYAQKARLGLKVGVNNTGRTWQRKPATSVDFHPDIFGRADVEKQVIDLLGVGTGQASSGANKLDVVAIVGMGGIGKTSLARHVFNNASVQKHFELKGWVCVSSQFDVERATRTILEKFGVPSADVAQLDLDGLKTKLEDKLAKEKKKFLLVLDDVWFTYDDWHSLRAPFKAAAAGSKVIITTRRQDVASMMLAVGSFTLQGLSDADCLSVFRQHAFDNAPSPSYPDVEPFYPKILEKCKGLPLAARVLGGLFRGKQHNDWEVTLKSEIWGLPEAEDGIMSTLRLSYHDLPRPLKGCFSYCSLLPKNYEFEEDEIVLLWMAEGLVADQGGMDMEDLGRRYFRELLSRSLFQRSNDHMSRFVMHDHVNDLARFVAGKSYVNLGDDLKEYNSFENARYVSYLNSSSSCGGNLIFEKCRNMKPLRAFLPFTSSERKMSLPYNSLLNLLPKLSYLRSLSLRGYDVRELPAEIGELTLLRYIDLSDTDIERLPESICFICNLQTLKLNGCRGLRTLPVDMRKLSNLWHLDLSCCYSLQSMPVGLDKLTCLRTISICVPESKSIADSSSTLEFLSIGERCPLTSLTSSGGSLPAPLRELRIHCCNKLEIVAATWPDDCSLKVLEISGCSSLTRLTSEDMPLPASLTKLKIWNCQKLEFVAASWPADSSCLQELEIRNCSSLMRLISVDMALPASLRKLKVRKCEKLEFVAPSWPADSSSCLQELKIRGCSCLTRLISVNMALPASLKKLKIRKCENLEIVAASWPADSSSCLQELEIRNCSSLTRLTSEDMALPASLRKLQIWTCEKLEFVAVSWPDDSSSCLQELEIWQCSSLTRLTSEDMTLPASLRKLEICKCEKLLVVAASWPADDSSCLQELEISECSSLMRLTFEDMALPVSLRKLGISYCEKLEFVATSWSADSSCLQELCIVCCSSLKRLTYEDMVPPASIRNLGLWNCEKLEIAAESWLVDSSLQFLFINECPYVTRLTSEDMALPASLENLGISNCEKLEFLAGSWPADSSCCLQELDICDCSSLTRLTSMDMALPASLRKLEIWNCQKLEIVAASWPADSSSLQELDIRDCSSVTRLTSEDMALPASLRELGIRNCEKLESVAASWPADSCLQEMDIRECSSLIRLTSEDMALPASLRKLEILNCEKLEFVAASWPAYSSCLQELVIHECSSARRLTSEDMVLPVSLRKLGIRNCEKLEYVAASWPADSSCSLQELEITDCSSLMRLTTVDMALPASLRKLEICRCEKLENVAASWPVGCSLENFFIWQCSSLTRLISVDMALPASLTKLKIRNCNKLEFVAESWPANSSLKELEIRDCSSLTRLTSLGGSLPASLKKLKILNCKKLEILAASWPFDSSLEVLEVCDCSSLTRLTSSEMELPASLRTLKILNTLLVSGPVDSSSS